MACQVQFKLKCSDTHFGCHVRVVGSSDCLGAWNPEKALRLSTGVDFPIWRSPPVMIDDDLGDIEYKYIIFSKDNRVLRWEERGNRFLSAVKIHACAAIVISDAFNAGDFSEADRFSSLDRRAEAWVETSFSGLSGSWCLDEQDLSLLDERSNSRSILDESTASFGGEEDGAAEGQSQYFCPTTRERSDSMSTIHAGPRGKLSWMSCTSEEMREAELAKEQANPQEQEEKSGDSGRLVREESGTNLFVRHDKAEAAEFESKYNLEGSSPLAEGGFGVVWCCKAITGGSTHAVKIIHKARLCPRQWQLLLGEQGEIETHLGLKHQHIVALYEAFDEASTVSLVMEHCRGGDLFDTITRCRKAHGAGLSESASAVAIRHILLALEYLHSLSIAHRDIKPENVLLLHEDVAEEENTFKLCDFGFATYDDGSGLTDRLGSPDTVAPEVIHGRPYGMRADVWSAGVLLYMMLSAKSPFWAPTDMQVLQNVAKAKYSLTGTISANGRTWDDVSKAARDCIASMMVVDTGCRPEASEVLSLHSWLKC